jgi:uncharacterized membrane protein YsdA (DUF1294 family)
MGIKAVRRTPESILKPQDLVHALVTSIGLPALICASTNSHRTRINTASYQLLLFCAMLCNLLILNCISTLNQ